MEGFTEELITVEVAVRAAASPDSIPRMAKKAVIAKTRNVIRLTVVPLESWNSLQPDTAFSHWNLGKRCASTAPPQTIFQTGLWVSLRTVRIAFFSLLEREQ